MRDHLYLTGPSAYSGENLPRRLARQLDTRYDIWTYRRKSFAHRCYPQALTRGTRRALSNSIRLYAPGYTEGLSHDVQLVTGHAPRDFAAWAQANAAAFRAS